MNFEFDSKTTEFLKIILKSALSQNLRVFFVGGIVRDKILNVQTEDIDLLLVGNAIEFAKNLSGLVKINSIHEEFCTVKLQYDEISIDIASSRTEKYPYSGCLPVLNEIGVEVSQDVLRRDFTLNSMYCELLLENDEIHYKIIDLVNGFSDLKNKELKVLHKNSYNDDPTRIIRGVGFKYRFGFDFSNEDKKLIADYLNNIDYSHMSIDRNYKVISQVLKNKDSELIFKEIIEKKYYKIITQDDINVDFLFLDEICKLFKFDFCQKIELYFLILKNDFVEKINFEKKLDIYKYFKKNNTIELAYYYFKTKDINVLIFNEIKDIKIHISGSDLLSLGFKQGKNIGLMLDSLLAFKLENNIVLEDKKFELEWILNSFPLN